MITIPYTNEQFSSSFKFELEMALNFNVKNFYKIIDNEECQS